MKNDPTFDQNDKAWEDAHKAAGRAQEAELDSIYRQGLEDGVAEEARRRDEAEALVGKTETLAQGYGATVVRACETLWVAIQKRHVDVPDCVVITGMGNQGNGWMKLGHHRATTWSVDEYGDTDRDERLTEIFLAGETIAQGATQVLTTLLHEAAHGIAHTRGIKETSRQGRYHNKRFVALAEELGLTTATEAHPVIGWSHTSPNDEILAEYAEELAAVEVALAAARIPASLTTTTDGKTKGEDPAGGDDDNDGDDEPKKKTGALKLVCDCEQPNIIRASRMVAEKMVVRCDDCGAHFHEEEE